jgi:hypothetical protein
LALPVPVLIPFLPAELSKSLIEIEATPPFPFDLTGFDSGFSWFSLVAIVAISSFVAVAMVLSVVFLFSFLGAVS